MSDEEMEANKAQAIEEFRHCVVQWINAECGQKSGRRHALEMAAAECQLLGIDPGTIEPTADDLAKVTRH
jgi:hypothetical protein